MDKYYYDIISTSSQGKDQYEGTIHFFRKDLTFEDMMEEASSPKNYPTLPHCDNVRFVLQGTEEWKQIMRTIKN